MLIYFSKGLIMEGENSIFQRKHFWNKHQEVRQKIYCETWISGICDESELDAEVERLTAEKLKSSGWGSKFSGWQRVVPYEESVKIYEEHRWDTEEVPKSDVRVDYIQNWKMEKILHVLTGKQFIQLCRENNVDPNKVMEN